VTLIQDFLNSVLTQVIVFLAILSGQLLYSLMLSDVDQKTYEYGMLRALGFKEGHLMTLISIQSFIFSVPGVLCGICTALILNMVFRGLIYLVSNNASGFWLTSTSIVVGVLFGLLMPLLAIYYPV
jgi:ABC-type antimicrobial peptide transport system permease subunit